MSFNETIPLDTIQPHNSRTFVPTPSEWYNATLIKVERWTAQAGHMNKVNFVFEITSARDGEQSVQSAGTDVFVTGRSHNMGVTTRLVNKDTGAGHPSWDKVKAMRDQRLAQLCAALGVGEVTDAGLNMAQFGWADDGAEATYDIVDTFEAAVGTPCAVFCKTSIRKDKQKKPVLNNDGKPYRDTEIIQVATPGQLLALNAEKENDDNG